jgi:hypothetical protein
MLNNYWEENFPYKEKCSHFCKTSSPILNSEGNIQIKEPNEIGTIYTSII